MEISIEALDVSCGYHNKTILENVTLHLSSGDFIGIIGPNGSGKTTLLRLLCKSLKPYGGVVLLNAKNLFSYSTAQIAQKIGVVPQEVLTSFSFTVLEIVLMGRNPHQGFSWGYSKDDYRVAKKAMELTKTLHLADRAVCDLSGGEKQQVVIAQVLAQEPQILLLDEPTSHLDINHQLEILDLVRELNLNNHLAVLAVFHDLNLAAQYCKHLFLLKDGKIVSFGKPDEILTTQHIKEVFGVDVAVDVHPLTQRLFITPLHNSSERLALNNSEGLRIHLICGGNTGVLIMNKLIQKGYRVTCGVLHILDTDQKTADFLGIQHASEAPFSPISDRAYKEGLKLANNADVVIITNLPFGYANLRNLDLAEEARRKGAIVIAFNNPPIDDRDYTGGEAGSKFRKLADAGAILIKTPEELFETLSDLKRRRSYA